MKSKICARLSDLEEAEAAEMLHTAEEAAQRETIWLAVHKDYIEEQERKAAAPPPAPEVSNHTP